jgi:hypothetical protein
MSWYWGQVVWVVWGAPRPFWVILAAVMAKVLGYHCALSKLGRRIKCRQFGERRTTIRTLETGERRLW